MIRQELAAKEEQGSEARASHDGPGEIEEDFGDVFQAANPPLESPVRKQKKTPNPPSSSSSSSSSSSKLTREDSLKAESGGGRRERG